MDTSLFVRGAFVPQGAATVACASTREYITSLRSRVWSAVSSLFAAISNGFSFIANSRLGLHVARHSTVYKTVILISLALLIIEGARRYTQEEKPEPART